MYRISDLFHRTPRPSKHRRFSSTAPAHCEERLPPPPGWARQRCSSRRSIANRVPHAHPGPAARSTPWRAAARWAERAPCWLPRPHPREPCALAAGARRQMVSGGSASVCVALPSTLRSALTPPAGGKGVELRRSGTQRAYNCLAANLTATREKAQRQRSDLTIAANEQIWGPTPRAPVASAPRADEPSVLTGERAVAQVTRRAIAFSCFATIQSRHELDYQFREYNFTMIWGQWRRYCGRQTAREQPSVFSCVGTI
eukprot:SAG11_NODE_373_length_10031_cov_37.400020_2_plen_257_part_00